MRTTQSVSPQSVATMPRAIAWPVVFRTWIWAGLGWNTTDPIIHAKTAAINSSTQTTPVFRSSRFYRWTSARHYQSLGRIRPVRSWYLL